MLPSCLLVNADCQTRRHTADSRRYVHVELVDIGEQSSTRRARVRRDATPRAPQCALRRAVLQIARWSTPSGNGSAVSSNVIVPADDGTALEIASITSRTCTGSPGRSNTPAP